MTYRDIDPKLAGIYIIKNNINGKCYIGQSIKLRSRIKDHLRNAKNMTLDLPIYRAINKYGFHNFTVDIIESFIPDPEMSTKDLIKKLDDLEIYYIDKYKAYENGYNCTKGGDFGVLGLKMTEEQKKKVSNNTKELITKGIFGKRVYMYNFVDKYYIYAWTIKDAANITKLSRSSISKLCNNKYINSFCNNFIAAYSIEELETRKNNLPIKLTTNNGKFERKYMVKVISNNKTILCDSVYDAANYLKVSNSMIYAVLSGYRHINGITLEKILQSDRKQIA